MERRFNISTEPDLSLACIFQSYGTQVRFDQGATIAAQGQPVKQVYRILRGCVRSCIYSQDGNRSVLQFLGPGDYLGLSGLSDWLASKEAVDTVVLEVMPQTAFEAAIEGRPGAQHEVRDYLARQVEAHASLLVLTSHEAAVGRVRAFLNEYAGRRGGKGFVSLPMGRQDIADHLGLSMETVSRSISTLRAAGEIALNGATFFRFLKPCPAQGDLPHAHAA